MFVCHYCKTSFKRKAFFCRNCSKPILNKYCCQIYDPLLTDKNENFPLNFEVIDNKIFYFVKEFKNYEPEDVNFYIQVNEIIKFLYFFCEKTKCTLFYISMTIEGDGQLIEPIDLMHYYYGGKLYYDHGRTLCRIEIDLKNSIKCFLDIYEKLEGTIIKKIEKIQVRLEKIC